MRKYNNNENLKTSLYIKTLQNHQQRLRPNLNINIRRNAWLCDCSSYEIISTLFAQVHSLQNNIKSLNSNDNKYAKSCYLTYLVNLNSYIFKNFLSNIEPLPALKCHDKQKHFWQAWYTKTCPNQVVTTTWNQPPATTTTYNPLYSINTTDTSLLTKYTISNSFYWIASVCISLITLSCVFVAWFYCWKRYSLSRRVLMLQRSRLPASNSQPTPRRHHHQRHRSRNNLNNNNNNAYILNARMAGASALPTFTSSEPPTSELESSSSSGSRPQALATLRNGGKLKTPTISLVEGEKNRHS